jgi:hypothetical protein
MALALRPPGVRAPLTSGALLAAMVALRVQMLPVAIVLFLFALVRWERREWVRAGYGALAMAIAVGGFDWLTWGAPFASYINNVYLQAFAGIAASFGLLPWWWYGQAFASASGGLVPLALVAGAVGCVKGPRNLLLPVACAAVLLGAHMVIGHKEYRFVFPVVALAGVMGAVVVARALEHAALARRRAATALVCLAFLAWSALGIADTFPGQRELFGGSVRRVDPAFAAYRALSSNDEVEAVLDLTRNWHGSPGYYSLHRDVPLYTRGDLRRGVITPISLSNSGRTASGVTSRPVRPVPPVVTTASIFASAIHLRMIARIALTSSGTMALSASS